MPTIELQASALNAWWAQPTLLISRAQARLRPARPPAAEQIGPDQVGENFQAIDDPRPAAIEIRIAIDYERAAIGDGRQIAIAGQFISRRASAIDRSRLNPHGATISTSGRAATTSEPRDVAASCRPPPAAKSPPAAWTSSGVQFPAAISGSVHSMTATRGRSVQSSATIDRFSQ